jgi:MoxR-like ATPase
VKVDVLETAAKTTPAMCNAIQKNLEIVVHGKTAVLNKLVVALIAGCHVLMEDVPGVGKTTLAKALAKSIGGDFKRIQFTPDLLPTDILGCSIYNPKESSFTFKQGPVFCNIVLADEINRASPRTQSSLLEAMSEGQVTVEGVTYSLQQPFVVLATQNPVEFHGTYPLPEAQLDRFGIKLEMGYPQINDEAAILTGQRKRHPLDELKPVISLAEILETQAAVREVRVEKPVLDYLLTLIHSTRNDSRLRLGSSPRGSLALYRLSQALAYTKMRDYVTPDDIQELAVPVLAHRLVLQTKSKYSGVSKEDVVRDLLEQIPVPT